MPTPPLGLLTSPAATPMTVLPDPVSLVSTLPVGFVPAVPLLTPPASVAMAWSTTATNRGRIGLLTANSEVFPVAFVAVAVKVSLPT